MSWRPQVLGISAAYKQAIVTGDFSKFVENKKNSKYSHDELKKAAGDFPDIKGVMDDAASHHEGLVNEYQSVTDDLESGGADKPTAIERVRAQGERLKAESIANVDASTERVLALIEGLAEDQRQRAADFWEALFYRFGAFLSEIFTQFDKIFESVVEWPSQVWEQVRVSWNLTKGVFAEIWAWLEGILA